MRCNRAFLYVPQGRKGKREENDEKLSSSKNSAHILMWLVVIEEIGIKATKESWRVNLQYRFITARLFIALRSEESKEMGRKKRIVGYS
jgi:hypothetical protein